MYYFILMLLPWQWHVGFGLMIFLLLLIVGYAYERIGERKDSRVHPPPGRLILVGDRKLQLLCKGTEGPTVVIEQGAGELSSFWWPVQDELAKFARVCTYDRAGYGWSDPVSAPRSVEDRARDLHTLLLKGQVQAPYIFVAHSYGGLIVRHYLREYPSEVAGLVLVDTPEQSSIFREDVLSFYAKARILNRLFGVAAQFGVLRLVGKLVSIERFGLWLKKPSEYSALCDDLASLSRVPVAMRVSERAGSLGSLPLTVITHGLPFPGPFAVLEQNWSEGQNQLASLSTDSVLIVAQNSNHMIQHDEPALVVDAIRRIHETTKRRPPLSIRDLYVR
jgi:pimeloyl-ACP methyl ester carboxylesterase